MTSFVTVENILFPNTQKVFFVVDLDDIFVASTNFGEIPSTDLHEISVEILNDSQHSPSRRSQLKQSPIDHDTSITQTGPMIIDIKKTANIRDSGFLDDEDGLSGGDSELATSRVVQSKRNESVSEDAPTPSDLMSRKLRSKTNKFCFSLFNSFV
jgi:hypothetical protein